MTKQQPILTFVLLIIVSVLTACSAGNNADEKQIDNTVEASEPTTAQSATKVIVFFGNSLTAGYGIEMNKAFPGLIQQKIDSLGLDYKVINAGNSGETSSGGKGRIDWILAQQVDVFILELGANDGLRGISTDETFLNLKFILEAVKSKNPEAKTIVAGMHVPPNMGPEYSEAFGQIFPKLAQETGSLLVPFILDGVAGNPDLNQEDRIHPTEEGHRILARNVWNVLKEVL